MTWQIQKLFSNDYNFAEATLITLTTESKQSLSIPFLFLLLLLLPIQIIPRPIGVKMKTSTGRNRRLLDVNEAYHLVSLRLPNFHCPDSEDGNELRSNSRRGSSHKIIEALCVFWSAKRKRKVSFWGGVIADLAPDLTWNCWTIWRVELCWPCWIGCPGSRIWADSSWGTACRRTSVWPCGGALESASNCCRCPRSQSRWAHLNWSANPLGLRRSSWIRRGVRPLLGPGRIGWEGSRCQVGDLRRHSGEMLCCSRRLLSSLPSWPFFSLSLIQMTLEDYAEVHWTRWMRWNSVGRCLRRPLLKQNVKST